MSRITQILQDPALVYYYTQKAIRSKKIRFVLGAGIAKLLPSVSVETRAKTTSNALYAERLTKEGILLLDDLISKSDLQSCLAQLSLKPLTDWYSGKQVAGINSKIPKEFNKLNHALEDVLSCSPLVKLANHPFILDLVSQYLGAKPTISSYQAWWTLGEHYQPGSAHYDDVYHRDVDDLRFIKLFVYLTDTTIASGAHCFVKGSHLCDTLARRGKISDEDVVGNFDPSLITTIAGYAGTAFLEDTWGIHRPLLATRGRRMIFSVIYSLTPWLPGRPRKPLFPLPQGLDAYINRSFFY